MNVVISGASGLIGTALTDRLGAAGHTVTALVRRPARENELRWDPAAGTLAADALDGADAVVNLAGAGINDHRWTDDYKRELVASRLKATELLVRTIARSARPPKMLLSASAIGYYGARHDERLEEGAAAGSSFLARLCVDWEDAAATARDTGVRVVLLRTGIVLTPRGGALRKELPIFKFGLGGRFGNGRQWQSWIALDDEIGAIEHLLTASSAEHVDGPVNLTAPTPVTNAEFTRILARVLHRPAFMPIPTFAPKLLLGAELAEALLFTGQRVIPAALQAAGYTFRHVELEPALRELLR